MFQRLPEVKQFHDKESASLLKTDVSPLIENAPRDILIHAGRAYPSDRSCSSREAYTSTHTCSCSEHALPVRCVSHTAAGTRPSQDASPRTLLEETERTWICFNTMRQHTSATEQDLPSVDAMNCVLSSCPQGFFIWDSPIQSPKKLFCKVEVFQS